MGSLRGEAPHNSQVGGSGGEGGSPPPQEMQGGSGGTQSHCNINCLMSVSVRFGIRFGRFCIKTLYETYEVELENLC